MATTVTGPAPRPLQAPTGEVATQPLGSTTSSEATAAGTETTATTAVSWGPRAATTAPAPSKLDALVSSANGKVVEAAINQVASEHDFGQDLNSGHFTSNVKLGEQVALKDSKIYTDLVKPDRLRSQFAQSNADSTWVKTRAVLSGGASLGVSPGVGIGLSVGFSGNMEVSSVMAQKTDSLKETGGIISSQAKSMVYPLDADGLVGLQAAPGTEWMFRGQATASLGATLGETQSIGGPLVGASATLGVSVGTSAQATYTKNVKVLENNKVFVQVARQTSQSVCGSIGARVGLNLNASGPVSSELTSKAGVSTVAVAGTGVDVAGQAGKLADSGLNKVEDLTRVTAELSASGTATQKVMAQAVLDLSTPAGKAAFDQIIRGGPVAAAELINKSGLGVTFSDSAHAVNTAASLKFGSNNVLSTSTFRGTEQGTVLDASGPTKLAETTYGRVVSGFLPRLFVGEERTVSVRAGSLQKGDGPVQDAVAVTLDVKDPRVHGDEVAQLQRFATAMGTQLDGLPQGKGNQGKGEYSVQVALTNDSIGKFQSWDKSSIRLAFASAQKEIEATPTMPPWYDKEQTFDHYVSRYNSADTNKGNQRQGIAQEYSREFPGRELSRDIESQKAVDAMSKQALEARGKPVEKWGKLLEAVGHQSSTDLRTSILALRRLSGAEIVGLNANVGGKTATVKSEVAAPKTMAQVVGELMAPPN